MGIYINDERKLISLTTENTEYAFCIDNQGLVRHLYWGNKINSPEDFDIPVLTEVSTNDPVYEITKEEYDMWRYSYPRIKAERLHEEFKKLKNNTEK